MANPIGDMTAAAHIYVVCSTGEVADIGVADPACDHDPNWRHAGIAGALMAAVFNYAASSAHTWRR